MWGKQTEVHTKYRDEQVTLCRLTPRNITHKVKTRENKMWYAFWPVAQVLNLATEIQIMTITVFAALNQVIHFSERQ